jgi:hypothetical protein
MRPSATFRAAALFLPAALLGACATDAEAPARDLARVALAQSVRQQVELNRKIQAESDYAKQALAAIRGARGKERVVVELAAFDRESVRPVQFQRDVTPEDLYLFGERVLRAVETSRSAQLEREALTLRTFRENVHAIEVVGDDVAAAQERLRKLQSPDTDVARARFLFAFAKKALDGVVSFPSLP